jgi:hypothetical protein
VHAGRGRQFRAVNIIWLRPDVLLNSRRLPAVDVLVLKRRMQVVSLPLPASIVGELRSYLGRGHIPRHRRTIRWSEPGIVRGFPLAGEG